MLAGIDRRRNAIWISETGIDALHELDAVVDATQDAFLKPLSPTERAQLNELLQRLLAHRAGYHGRMSGGGTQTTS